MRIPRVYSAEPLRAGMQLRLDDQAAHHLGQVLRLDTGAALILFDGQGHDFPAELEVVGRQAMLARVGEPGPAEPTALLRIHLGIGVSRGERMDYVVQKAVELGVSSITPLLAARTVVQLKGERKNKRLAHWQGVLTAACEQSGRRRLPQLHPIHELAVWTGLRPMNAYMLDHRASQGLREMSPPPKNELTLLIGPEGGLNEAERSLAGAHGFMPLRLGPRVMRTETAPVAAIAAIQTLWGDLG